mgnify:CR=1 FL=1
MAQSLDQFDTRLLTLLQKEVPLTDRPFATIARELGVGESQVLDRIARLRSQPNPVIRQISGIFDTKSLGYESTLVAARVAESELESAVRVINAHPGVTHNYLRNHAYNLWYTVAVPPDSRLGLERTVDVLHRQSGAIATRMFPTLKLYKIGVNFDLGGGDEAPRRTSGPGFSHADRARAMQYEVTETDKRMIRVLQQDLPAIERPFDRWAEQAQVGVDELLSAARSYLDQKRMRRFSAVLHHREAGISANGMGVWVVPPGQQEQFGATAATFNAVSHCYLRPTYEDWPYSIFTMVHGATRADCEAVFQAIAKATGVVEYAALYSTVEYKKVRLRYFAGDIEAWEAARMAEA